MAKATEVLKDCHLCLNKIQILSNVAVNEGGKTCSVIKNRQHKQEKQNLIKIFGCPDGGDVHKRKEIQISLDDVQCVFIFVHLMLLPVSCTLLLISKSMTRILLRKNFKIEMFQNKSLTIYQNKK